MQMLESNGLKCEHYPSVEEALDAAEKIRDAFIAQQPDLQEVYPPKIFPDDRRLSKWYFETDTCATRNLFSRE